MLTWLLLVAVVLAVAVAAWAFFEAGWLRARVLEVELDGVPEELDGLRIAHLSDFHLGVPSRGRRATEKAVSWVAERRPDLVCITGDLLSRRRGAPLLRRLLDELGPSYAVLGNHDLADSRDPFAQRVEEDVFADIEGLTVLHDEDVVLELRGRRVQLVGVEPREYALRRARPERLADGEADLRVLLCHFPGIVRRVPEAAFHLVLAGHLHAGQIVLPLPGRKLGLAHLRQRHVAGLSRHGSTVLHISPGLGTTFVPFRLFARPEATELVVRSPDG
jgi:predicted MPP superfamily phosphohydrolase